MSGIGAILSLDLVGELLFRSTESEAHRVGSGTQDDGDFARFEILPRPQSEYLLIGGAQSFQRGRQLGGVFCRQVRWWYVLDGAPLEAIHQLALTAQGSAMVRQRPLRDAIRPGKHGVGGNVFETSPDRHQRLFEDVVGVVE